MLFRSKKKYCNTQVQWRRGADRDPKLVKWAGKQRHNRKQNQLSKERIRLLDKIGFVWDLGGHVRSVEKWDEMYRRLLVYKADHDGDVNVPFRYEKDVRLGKWVSKQRWLRKCNTIQHERFRLLDSIDFTWRVDRHKQKQQREGGRCRNHIVFLRKNEGL